MTHIEGHFYRVASSARHLARMHVTDSGRVTLTLNQKEAELTLPTCDFDQLDISDRLANTSRFINFPDGSHLESADNEAIDQLLKQFNQGQGNRLLHYLENHLLLVLVMVVLVAVFSWGFVKYGVPEIARVTANAMPQEVVSHLGQGTLQILDESFFEPSQLEESRKNQLLALFHRYSRDYDDLNITIDFRSGKTVGANAMALPDGHIIFTDELIELSQDDLELVAILAHEIGHVQQRHLLRRLIQNSMVTVLLVMITGDVSSASSIIYAMPALLLELSFSRSFEHEADDFAYQFLIKHDIDTEYFAEIMSRLVGMSQSEIDERKVDPDMAPGSNSYDYLSTHPAPQKRIQRFITP